MIQPSSSRSSGAAVVLAPYYRRFDLPWEGDPEANRRFRRMALIGLAIFFVVGAIVPWLKFAEPTRDAAEAVPERLARLMVEERPKPPPPPPPPPPTEEPQPREEPKPVPQPEQRQAEARRRAEQQLSQVRDELADLRREFAQALPETRNLTAATVAEARSDRSLITSRVGSGSGGVQAADTSRGFGGGGGALAGHTASTVQSSVASVASSAGVSRGGSGKPSRSAEEIEQEFDRNKGAIYALYTRALRERPELQGKVVLEFTIAADGAVNACRVVSSELNYPELEGRICTRVKAIRFPARDVAAVTTTKPIEFFPQG